MTTAIASGFGSRLKVRVLLVNNERTDFSFRSHSDASPHTLNRFDTYALENGTDATTPQGPLRNMGYPVNLRDLKSRPQATRTNADGALTQGARKSPWANGPAIVGWPKLLQKSRSTGEKDKWSRQQTCHATKMASPQRLVS
ncbi:hypothetical protein [Sedimentitalea todarodis]|uniref:hypothetical protein n=1 Tax=Sedimentitalea todarodis TaxID=1631240 RepID=UPI00292E2D66|nr:hypothetical protein [Sedimentitalea todarodis]